MSLRAGPRCLAIGRPGRRRKPGGGVDSVKRQMFIVRSVRGKVEKVVSGTVVGTGGCLGQL